MAYVNRAQLKVTSQQLARRKFPKEMIITLLDEDVGRPNCFSLCVDDFGVKYVSKHHAEHLMSVLRESYKISHDWKGRKYSGLDLYWDYIHRKVHLSMLSYVTYTLTRFRHNNP